MRHTGNFAAIAKNCGTKHDEILLIYMASECGSVRPQGRVISQSQLKVNDIDLICTEVDCIRFSAQRWRQSIESLIGSGEVLEYYIQRWCHYFENWKWESN